jgi:hypothetical protein
MASLFAEGWIGEHGHNAVLAGLRVYFGQRDKSLIDRHRQDDPSVAGVLLASTLLGVAAAEASVFAQRATSGSPVQTSPTGVIACFESVCSAASP